VTGGSCSCKVGCMCASFSSALQVLCCCFASCMVALTGAISCILQACEAATSPAAVGHQLSRPACSDLDGQQLRHMAHNNATTWAAVNCQRLLVITSDGRQPRYDWVVLNTA
jgi:hypothetical protein